MKRRTFLTSSLAVSALTACGGKNKMPSHGSDMGSIVFEPIKIGNVTVPNRIVFPAVTNRYADEEGFVTPRLIDFHRNIAAGGAGLSIIGATAVRKDGIIISKMHRLDENTCIKGMGQLCKAIKSQGSVSCIQLFHAGRKSLSMFTGVQPVGPSPIPHPNYKDIPRELSQDEIQELVTCFGQSARRAKKAGAQMIELHGAHGYLICQFLSPFSNRRKDGYGGSTENRARFLREIIAAVRSNVGKKYPICCRISADEYIKGGLTVEESQYIAQILAESGADIISVSAGIDADVWAPGKEDGRRCYAHLARAIKEVVKVPVIGVGNILDVNDAEIVLQYGDADMAAMGRALIADPYLVRKTLRGQTAQIDVCIQCRNCLASLVKSHMTCTVNNDL